MPAAELNIDTREFNEAMDEGTRLIRFADYHCITENARKFVRHIVQREFGYRTGNLRSAMRPAWKALGMPGTPMTNITLGEKTIKWIEKGRIRVNKFMSNGTVEDHRNDPEKPSFKFACYAAEWRKKNAPAGSKIGNILRSGLISARDIRKVSEMLLSGASYAQVYGYLVLMLSSSPRGVSFLMGEGAYKPYQFIKKGNRRNISARFDFGKWHQKELDKIKGKTA